MRRPPRHSAPGVSLSSHAILGRRAISSRRNRTRSRTQSRAAVNNSQISSRTRISSSRLLTAQQRPSAESSAQFYSALSSLIESAAKESRDNVIMASQKFAVPWDRIKLWVDAQEKADQRGERTLTNSQLAALSQLVDFVVEPEVSGQDYVSLLMQYTQPKKNEGRVTLKAPKYEDVGLEVPIKGMICSRWRTTCTLPWISHKAFPCEGWGLSRGEESPVFASKKASKQYAAKYAWNYLQANKPSPAITIPPAPAPAPAPVSDEAAGGITLQPAASSKAKPPKSNVTSPNASSSSLALPTGDTGGASLLPPPPSAEATAKDNLEPTTEPQTGSKTPKEDGDASSIYDQVAELGKQYGYGPPEYKIDTDPKEPERWAGKPKFQNGGRIPDYVGHVEGAISKTAAKEQIAKKLLEFFETVKGQKEDIRKKLMVATFGTPSKEGDES